MPIVWSDPRPPIKDISYYNHVVAETPLGELRLDWKGWKDNDSPTAVMPWGEVVIGINLDDAKQNVQSAWDKMVERIVAFSN